MATTVLDACSFIRFAWCCLLLFLNSRCDDIALTVCDIMVCQCFTYHCCSLTELPFPLYFLNIPPPSIITVLLVDIPPSKLLCQHYSYHYYHIYPCSYHYLEHYLNHYPVHYLNHYFVHYLTLPRTTTSNTSLLQVKEQGACAIRCPGFKCGEVLGLEWAPVLLKRDIVELLTVQRIKHVRSIQYDLCGRC